MEVFCDSRRPREYRAVAHCETTLSSWYSYGNYVWTDQRNGSRADCYSVLGPVWVRDYHVDWRR
ncbi:hypothetical protein FKR81_42125 [Lentzea tibetensis]|uniref:Uncharacterized protein n=1 Tax=Lentzea tibetensis TaxID=2591470 RepID=A0A563EF41_9PSEU|nr:hypothetical protein [Lentzea tibetensis]TWP43784.1 hypothetical protein FKR81_42125 [Lentzea tibetensis]